jgi:hypothetical protein
VVNLVALVTLHGRGPAALTENILPVTSAQVTCIAAPVIGLVPIFPVITDLGTSVIHDFDRITKLPATPRSTATRCGRDVSATDSAEEIPEPVPGDILLSFVQPPNNTTNSVAMAGNNACFECTFLLF